MSRLTCCFFQSKPELKKPAVIKNILTGITGVLILQLSFGKAFADNIVLNDVSNFAKISGAISIKKHFTPPVVGTRESARLILNLQNSYLSAVTDITLTKQLPVGLFIDSQHNMSNNCGSVISTTNGLNAGQINIIGAKIPARTGKDPGSCTIVFNVIPSGLDTYTSLIEVGAITGIIDGQSVSNTQAVYASLKTVTKPVLEKNSHSTTKTDCPFSHIKCHL